MVDYNNFRIEANYKEEGINLINKTPDKYYWHNGVRVSESYAKDVFKLTPKQLRVLTKRHGVNALKHVTAKTYSENVVINENDLRKIKITHNGVGYESMVALARDVSERTGIPIGTIKKRYEIGDRGERLERCKLHIEVKATNGEEVKMFESVKDCAIFFKCGDMIIHNAMNNKSAFRGYELEKIYRK